MPRLNFEINEERLLRKYKIGSLHPKKWEEIDHDFEESIGTSYLDQHGLEREKDIDPLGLPHTIDVNELDAGTRATILITSKTFDPATYLSVLHPDATYHDLATAIGNLQNSLASRAEALRVLVEDQFDKFASVKATIEGLHEDMKSGILADQTDYGSKPLRDHLKQGGQRANQIFLPVLESASKARKLRTTLTIFERSRFFFNLPSFIIESIDAGRYDLAIRDYKKGKYILENRPGQLLPIGPIKDDAASLSEQQRQKRILNKVWAITEKAMAEMKRILVSQLEDPNRSVEEHEKTLEILMDFQSNDEPLWTYFDSQNTQTINRMSSEHEIAIKRIEATLRDIHVSKSVEQQELQIAILQLRAKQPDDHDATRGKSVADPGWQAVLDLVKTVSELTSSSLHNFWSISKSFINGKFKRPTSTTHRSPTQCRTMALSIVKHYISLISQTFMLSDVVIMTAFSSDATSSRPPLLPAMSHSLSTAHHLQKILAEVQECVNEITFLDISVDVNQGVKNLLESVQGRFLEVLSRDWLKDAKLFYQLESWRVEPEETTATSLPSLFELFQKHMAIAGYNIVTAADPSHPPSRFTTKGDQNLPISRKKSRVPLAFTTRLTKTFMDTIYAFLDGLVLLTIEDLPEGAGTIKHVRGTAQETGLHELVDLRDGDIRKLLVLSNIQHLNALFSDMMTRLEGSLGIKLPEDRQTLRSVIEALDETLFNGYMKPKKSILAQKSRGILSSNFDWYNAPQPTGLRSYVYDIMNYLVELHAQVCTVSENLLDRMLNAALGELVEEAVKYFSQVKQFGTGGLLTAVMELSFIQKSLGYYGRETAAGKLLEDLYTQQITNVYTPSATDTDFNVSFQAMQQTLADARRATAVQFLCFRQSNSKSQDESKGGGRERGKGGEGVNRKETGIRTRKV